MEDEGKVASVVRRFNVRVATESARRAYTTLREDSHYMGLSPHEQAIVLVLIAETTLSQTPEVNTFDALRALVAEVERVYGLIRKVLSEDSGEN